MKAIKDYHEFHLKCDVLLFADVFEEFRNNRLKNYGICPSLYLRAAGLSYLKSYDPKAKSKHIIYLDANNLYGYAMSKLFPTSGFEWVDPEELDLNKYVGNSLKGCALEADLEYPRGLHELHNDYTLPSDKKEINGEILYESQLKFCDL